MLKLLALLVVAACTPAALEPRRSRGTDEGSRHAPVDLDKLDIHALINRHQFSTIGVGVAQSARDGPLVGTIWIVVLFY